MKHIWIVLALALGAGCKKESSPPGGGADGKVASCNQPSLQSCREYRGGNLAMGTEMLEKLCSAVAPGAFTLVACPTAGVIGSCAKPEGKDFFYEGYAIPLADVETQCTSGGGTFAK